MTKSPLSPVNLDMKGGSCECSRCCNPPSVSRRTRRSQLAGESPPRCSDLSGREWRASNRDPSGHGDAHVARKGISRNTTGCDLNPGESGASGSACGCSRMKSTSARMQRANCSSRPRHSACHRSAQRHGARVAVMRTPERARPRCSPVPARYLASRSGEDLYATPSPPWRAR